MTQHDNWYDDHSEVLAVGRWLLDTSQIRTCDELHYYFEKPWKWSQEREDMIRAERNAA